MLESLEIDSFRCFDRFEMKDLARVNLLVGTNNSGKTSVLEALSLWAARGHPDILWETLQRRGEARQWRGEKRLVGVIRHLFHGHRLDDGETFAITGVQDMARCPLHISVVSRPSQDDGQLLIPDPSQIDRSPSLTVEYGRDDRAGHAQWQIRLRDEEYLRGPPYRFIGDEAGRPLQFVTTRSLGVWRVSAMLGAIVLTEDEDLVINALRTIEPTIERIALGGDDPESGHGGIVVRCSGQKTRIPIGSMGDGIWRMLALALTLVSVRGGMLLVDEIDTGLHFGVMADMWRLVCRTAARLDVQVFATTHSYDCVQSLAQVLGEDEIEGVAIHRIERDARRSVVFDEDEIVLAAQRSIEMR